MKEEKKQEKNGKIAQKGFTGKKITAMVIAVRKE